MASTEVDDTDPRFDYKDNDWTAGGQAGEFDLTSHSTDIAGAQVVFGPFSGTSIAVFSTVGTSQTRVHFFVDSGDQGIDLPAESSSGVKFQQQLYSASNLATTKLHTLQINLLDSGPFTLDYVLIGGELTTRGAATITTTTPSLAVSSTPTTTTSLSTSTTTSSSVSTATSTGPTSSSTTTTTTTSSSSSSTPTSTPTPVKSPAIPTSSQTSTGPASTPQPVSSNGPSSSSGSSRSTLTSGSISSVLPSSSTPVSVLSSAGPGPDMTVIASVTGAIVFFAIIVVSVVLYYRRRQQTQGGRSIPQNRNVQYVPSEYRPTRFSIPSLPSPTRRPSFILPMHNNASTSSTNPLMTFAPIRARSPFHAGDADESPVLDINRRPPSGSTITTRVTVGTSIGQRSSEPDFANRYSYPEVPVPAMPGPPLLPTAKGEGANASPVGTGLSSALGTSIQTTFGFGGTSLAATNNTSVFSSPVERRGTVTSDSSASRPLPYTPTDVKLGTNPFAMRVLPIALEEDALEEDAETVVHMDAGVRLASNTQQERPRRELPPPYRDYRD